jgi:hypothetical protein
MQDVLDLMLRASKVCEFPAYTRGIRTRQPDVGYIELVSLAIFDRCHSLQGAAYHLLARGYVHEAAILGRPLFGSSLTLAELAESDQPQREALLIGLSLDHLARHEAYLRSREELGEDMTAHRERLEQARRGEQAFARERGVTPKHEKPEGDLKARAIRHGRVHEYGALLLSHGFVHGASGVVLDRVGREGDRAVIGGHVARSRPWVRDFGLFATFSLLHAGVAICSILEWPQPDELKAMMREIATSTAAARKSSGSTSDE